MPVSSMKHKPGFGFLLLLLLLVLWSHCVFAASKAESLMPSHYRLWQGYALNKFAHADFLKVLEENFLPDTASLTPIFGMKAYLVAIPPASTSIKFPDEIALLKYSSEDEYRKMFTEEAGRNYVASHWDVFTRRGSKSLVARPFSRAKAEYFPVGFAYDVIEHPADWQTGYTVFYLGRRLATIKPKEFMERMHAHVESVKRALGSNGLQGYFAVIAPDYEIAFMNWPDEAAMKNSYSTDRGKAAIKEAAALLETIMWEPVQKFKGKLEPGKAYLVK